MKRQGSTEVCRGVCKEDEGGVRGEKIGREKVKFYYHKYMTMFFNNVIIWLK